MKYKAGHEMNAPIHEKIVSARELERLGILKRRTALRMAALGLIPHYKWGARLHSVGFIANEVLQSLKHG